MTCPVSLAGTPCILPACHDTWHQSADGAWWDFEPCPARYVEGIDCAKGRAHVGQHRSASGLRWPPLAPPPVLPPAPFPRTNAEAGRVSWFDRALEWLARLLGEEP